jgi:DNA-binding transcriptional MerR regulator
MARRMTFHTGEFARMTGVNKRTLHYYDAEGIFKPDSVEPNGYRSYSYRQIYPFYMIRMFRQMGLELSEIKEYMVGRTPEKFLQLVTEQEKWLDQELQKLRHMKQIVRNKRQTLLAARDVRCGQVEERAMGGETMLISVNIRALCLKDDWAGLERLMAAHMREMLDLGLGVGDTFGTMIAPEDFMKPGTEQILSYYGTKMERPPRKSSSKQLNQLHQRPIGRYLVTYFSGDYMETVPSYELLRAYMQAHDLEPDGYAYEESLIEEMGTPDPDEFITKISVPVRACAGKS